MGSTILDPLPTGAIDRFGLSVASATRDGTERKGTIYDPVRFAAAVPVHFHPLGGPNFLGLFDGYWVLGTPSTSTPGRYTAKTALARPAAVVINAATGQISVPSGMASFSLPVSAYTSLRLNSAASSVNFVMTLCTGDSKAVLSHWNTTADGLQLRGEYVIPDVTADGQTVRFDRGVYFDPPWIYLWGVGLSDHRIYTARQYQSRLGAPWLYQSDTGWSATADPTPSTTVTTLGPMSTTLWRGFTFVTTVATSGSNKVGQIWTSRSMSNIWVKRAEMVIDTTTAWTGNGLMLQPQVATNPASVDDGAIGAIPLVRTAHLGTGGNESLTVSWDLFSVPRLMA